ncbi:MAG: hypothetical protein IKM35_09460 [Bacteroidaceae bacterium]|nr:hypothetical protein [Bacteroidaceae bacterium]
MQAYSLHPRMLINTIRPMQLKEIKRMYRLYMNGIVSSSMREKGAGYRVNFGLTLPLLTKIAEQIPPSVAIAEELWNDCGVRESMLLAPMVFPAELCQPADAQRWVTSIPNVEVSDFCCKFLFSRLPYATSLATQWTVTPQKIVAYTGFRLACAILSDDVDSEWLSYIADNAIIKAYNNDNISSSSARNFLIEALLLPHAGSIVVKLLQENVVIDNKWRENLIAIYNEEC